MQRNFLEYMRKEALTSSVYIVAVMLVASLLTLANYIMSRDKTGNSDKFCIVIIINLFSVSLLTVRLISSRQEKFIEYTGLTIHATFLATLLSLRFSN